VSTTEPLATYRYVSDGSLTSGPARERVRVFGKPWVWLAFFAIGFGLGIHESGTTYDSSFPYYPGRVLLSGVIWGLCWVVGTALFVAVIVWLRLRIERRRLRRLFPVGSITEVTVRNEGLELARPIGTKTLPYDRIKLVKPTGSVLVLCVGKSGVRMELLPAGLLPDDAVAYVTARSRGLTPVPVEEPTSEGARRFVVSPGWAKHVARVYTMSTLRRREVLQRFALATLVILGVAALVSPSCLVAVPLLWALLVFGIYEPSRRNVERDAPEGSLMTAEFAEDRIISRNTGGERVFRYPDVVAVDVRRDVVVVRLRSRETRLMARALLPDEVLARLLAEGR
jgi:hypothetical protein